MSGVIIIIITSAFTYGHARVAIGLEHSTEHLVNILLKTIPNAAKFYETIHICNV